MVQVLDYELYMRELVSITPIQPTDIFFYDSEPYTDDIIEEFHKLFSFYQGWLNRQKRYGIIKGFFFFNPNSSVNAKATRYDDYFIMTINKGTVLKLWQEFQIRDELFLNPGLEKFNIVQHKSDYPFNKLMFQLCCHFTFYHELGHLIQKSELLKDGMSEDVEVMTTFDSARHLLEYDADIFSAICLGTHVYQYIEDWCFELESGDAELIISGIASSIFVYLMMFESVKAPFYLKACTHPHPFVRLIGVSYYLTDYINFIDGKHKQFDLNIQLVYQEFTGLAKALSRHVLGDENSRQIDDLIANNMEEAIQYNNTLADTLKTDENLAVNKRNHLANK